jgi:hypothetical protein
MKVVIATHGHCFDGLASAVVLTRMLRSLTTRAAAFEYHACGYGIGQPVANESMFTGDENAILDYRFHPSSKLTWYFDHHRTAFASEADRQRFEQQKHSGRFHFEPSYSSCTQLIYDVARREMALDIGLEPLVRWADTIDSAGFTNPEAAIDRSEPEMRLASVVEQHANAAFLARWVPELEAKPLREVAESPVIEALFRPIGARHAQFVQAVRARAETQGSVVYVDLAEEPLDFIGKFVTYALYPRSVYSVVLARLKRGYKISVGYNPWSGAALDVDISAICARFGGGGHPVVGGISLAEGQPDAARMIARKIVAELNGDHVHPSSSPPGVHP